MLNWANGPVAQRLEQQTHNLLVVGSNPTGPTYSSLFCRDVACYVFGREQTQSLASVVSPRWCKLLSVKTRLLQIAVLIGMVNQVSGQSASRPDVPDKIKAPAGEEVVLQVHAVGSQIYVCQTAADGKSAWTLKAPEAELHDQQGAVIGRHYAGPTWKHNDGSEVTGKAAAKIDSPDADSIPWLLVTATGHSGDGVLSHVTSIQRIHTKGGPPPAGGCDASKQNQEVKSSYTADYYFYAPPK